MASLDDVIELVNTYVDIIEDDMGVVNDRTTSISEQLSIIDNGLSRFRKIKRKTDMIEYVSYFISTGVCCLEQYTYIIEDSCPQEYDYSYDEPKSIDEYVEDMEYELMMAFYFLGELRENGNLNALYRIKAAVIQGVSLLLHKILV